ncbi:SLC13 family permease [Salinibacter sp. 10B]|nr:SLC13 family permease [Salinibacter sp. 10B]PQJ33827.1 SLC13 family permease [Salinibacter sp. 10B]
MPSLFFFLPIADPTDTVAMEVVLGILAVTVVLIVTEVFRIDVVALLALLALVWTGSISPEQARSGFASNAVLAIIGVMIMGRGLFRSGVTEKIASFILQVAGRGKRRILSTVSITVGIMSGFMQNIGAAALFLPVMTGISKREQIPISSLLMPMGFAALLGGTLTMVGTSSLIVLNDLLTAQGLDPFGLFTVLPIGLLLLGTGILYFFVVGPYVLPSSPKMNESASPGKKLLNVWGLSDSIFTLRVPSDSPLIGQSPEESEMGARYNLNLLRVFGSNGTSYDIWEDFHLDQGQKIVVQGHAEDVEQFAESYALTLAEEDVKTISDSKEGYLEVVIPARSQLVGKTIRDLRLREKHNTQVVLFFSESQVVEDNVADRKIQAGDTLVLQGKWENLQFFDESDDYITVTPLKYDQKKPEKAWLAVGSFAGAIALVLGLNFSISMGFLSGALAMVLGGVLTIEEAYRAVEWKVIFLIAGLIPIGIAMETSGSAALIAETLVAAVQSMPPYLILFILGILMTIFSLIMSNVAATVLMVPLVLEMGGAVGLPSEVMVLQVGLCAANSFILPTHHVNALLMTPGGYRVNDYLKAGSLLSLLFVTVSTTVLYFFYM